MHAPVMLVRACMCSGAVVPRPSPFTGSAAPIRSTFAGCTRAMPWCLGECHPTPSCQQHNTSGPPYSIVPAAQHVWLLYHSGLTRGAGCRRACVRRLRLRVCACMAKQTCLAAPNCKSVETWGFTDKYTWIGTDSRPLLFDTVLCPHSDSISVSNLHLLGCPPYSLYGEK